MRAVIELVEAAQAGDSEAYDTLIERFQPMAYALAHRSLGDHHLAQDVVQEALIEAFVHLSQLKEPEAFPGSLRPEPEKSNHCFGSLLRSRERRDLPGHPLPGRDAMKPEGVEQVERWRLSRFRFEKDARCSMLLRKEFAVSSSTHLEVYCNKRAAAVTARI
jgi:Sigma-70 region 2